MSRLKVDPFNYVTAGIQGATTFSGTLQTQDIKSDIGRAGLRVGTTINAGNVIWQPFAAVSVWHEFGPSSSATYATCSDKAGGPGCAFLDSTPWRFQPQPRPQPLEPLGNTPWASRPKSRAQAGLASPESITVTAQISRA